jgi:hypothetical protein
MRGTEAAVVASIVAVGESPDSVYLRRALSGDILYSKYIFGEDGGRVGEIGNTTELSILHSREDWLRGYLLLLYFGDVNVSGVRESAPCCR